MVIIVATLGSKANLLSSKRVTMKIHNGYIFIFGVVLLTQTLLLAFVKGSGAKWALYMGLVNVALLVYGFIYGKFSRKKKVLPK
jgi:hypothetical protein